MAYSESPGRRGLTEANLAQIVYTLTQFPTVKQVRIAGKRYTRADFEDWTPAILVESPLAFETVSNPIRATGTANTFEANFQYEVVNPAGKVVDTHFVTATSGTGTRGTFDFTTKRYTGKAGRGRTRGARVLGEGRLADEGSPHPDPAAALDALGVDLPDDVLDVGLVELEVTHGRQGRDSGGQPGCARLVAAEGQPLPRALDADHAAPSTASGSLGSSRSTTSMRSPP